MISATCKNSECIELDILYNCEGFGDPIKCGTCNQDCELTDPRPDPTPAA